MLWRLLFAFLFSPSLFGQIPSGLQYKITQFTTKEGLVNNACHDVIADKEGFVWVAMDGGLMRFDGSKFVSYGEDIGLGNQTIIHMRKDAEGSLWMHTVTGDIFIKPEDSDQVRFFTYNDTINAILNKTLGFSKDIFCISEDQTLYLENYGNDEIIYIDSLGKIGRINSELKQKGFDVIALEDGQAFPLSVSKHNLAFDSIRIVGNRNFPIQGDSDLSAYENNGIVKFGDLSFHVDLTKVTLESRKSVHVLHQDTFLIQTNNVLSIFTRDNWIASIESDLVLDIHRMLDGSFLVGYKQDSGLRWFKDINALIRNQYVQLLKGYSVTCISDEFDNGFWVATLEGGLFYYSENIVSPFIKEGPVRFAEILGDSSLIIGDLKSVKKIDLNNNTRSTLFTAKNEIRGITLLDSLGSLAISALPSALLDLNNDGRSINLYRYRTRFTQNGELLISTTKTGLKKAKYFKNEGLVGLSAAYFMKYHIGDSIPYYSSNIEGQIPYLRINDIEEFEGGMVLATDTGLIKIVQQSFSTYTFGDIVFKEKISQLDNIWGKLIITNPSKGFYVLDTTGEVSRYLLGTNFPGNNINKTVTSDSAIFICSDKGLTYYALQKDSLKLFYHLSTADGLADDEIFDVCRVNDTVFVATAKGIDQLDLNDIKDRPARIIIEYINDRYVRYKKARVEIPPDENILVRFATPRKVNEVFNLNRYRLNQSKWVYNQSNEIRFSSLRSGDYLLEVCVQDNNGAWNSCDSITFRQLQVWYKSAEFIIFLAVLSYWILTYYFRNRLRKQELQREIDLQIIDLERKALSAQMNPHFIFNVLNSIQNFIYFNDKKSAMRFLSKFAGLVRKSLNASSQSYITLEEEMDLIKSYLELEELRNNNRFDSKIDCNCKYNQASILVPPMLVQPFVENAVFHGMKTMEKGGMIEVYYSVNEGYIEVDIKDNGSGFKETDLNKEDSYGIKLTRQRLELINKASTPQMSITSEEGNGTHVKIYIDYGFIERS